MLWSIDTCQKKVSADQYHLTISRTQVRPHQGQLFFFFFFKLTADQVLVFDWIAGSVQVRHLNVNEVYFFARVLRFDPATRPYYVNKSS